MIQLSTLQIVTLAALTSALAACQESSAAPTPKPAAAATTPAADAATTVAAKRSEAELIALGEHLVKAGGCGDCHTPLKMGPNGPEPDMTRMLSGHPASMKLPPAPPPSGPWMVSITATNTAYAGPWGTSFTANLTPDMGTGLGSWSRDTFIETIRKGRHMGSGRALLPPMPIPAYQNFSDDELGAVFAYLHSIPAIENQVPEPLPPPNAPKPRG